MATAIGRLASEREGVVDCKFLLSTQRLVSCLELVVVHYLIDALLGDTKLLRYPVECPVLYHAQVQYLFVSFLTFFCGFTLAMFSHSRIILDFN